MSEIAIGSHHKTIMGNASETPWDQRRALAEHLNVVDESSFCAVRVARRSFVGSAATAGIAVCGVWPSVMTPRTAGSEFDREG